MEPEGDVPGDVAGGVKLRRVSVKRGELNDVLTKVAPSINSVQNCCLHASCSGLSDVSAERA